MKEKINLKYIKSYWVEVSATIKWIKAFKTENWARETIHTLWNIIDENITNESEFTMKAEP